MKSDSFKIGITTFETKEEAVAFSRLLIEKSWAVCAQVDDPILSIYKWKKKVEESKEVRLWIKFFDDKSKLIENELMNFHSYEVAQWCVLDVDQVGAPYFKWAMDSVEHE